MLSRSTVVGALVVAELAIVGLALRSLGFGSPAAPQAPLSVHVPDAANLAASVSGAGALIVEGQRLFATSAAPRVVIALDSEAALTVRAVAGSAVRVSLTGSKIGWPGGSPPPLTTEKTPDGVRIAIAAGSSGFSLGGFDRAVTVDVPPDARVEITSADGSVTTSGLQAALLVRAADGAIAISDQRGNVEARTEDGSIRLTDVDADRLVAHSSDGSIVADNVRLADGELTTDDGHVEVNAAAASDSLVAIHTDDGSVRIGSGLPTEHHSADDDDDRQSRTVTLGSARGKFTIATSDGHVSLSQGAKV